MSSVRSTRRANGQLRRRDESPLQHAIRRSRRVAGEAPETGPYQPPRRRPPRQEPAYQEVAHPRSPSPPSSDFTFARPHPPVPSPGFSPAIVPSNTRHPLVVHHPPLDEVMSHVRHTRRDSALATPSQSLPALIKIDDAATPPEEREVERACDICCEAAETVLQPCRTCPTSYCGDCIRTMFIDATHDSTSMPPRCCTILPTTIALDFITTTEAENYRLKFEEWVSTNKTYCPVPQCSRFIPDRAVLSPPPTDPVDLWGLLKQELPRIMASLKTADCARFFRGPMDPAAHGFRDWKPSKKPMVWLNEMSAKLSRYADIDEFISDFNRLVFNARSMPVLHPIAIAVEELRKRLWKEVSSIKARPNNNFSTLPAGACFSCPGCHIAICPTCKQVAHFGTPCDTTAQDHEVAMLATYGYKKCPRCGHGVKRMFGCRHMQCRCGAHWCWGCLLPIEDCDGGCTPPSPDSEDGYYSDEDEEPGTPPTEVMPQGVQNGGTDAAVPAPTPVPTLPLPSNSPQPATGTSTVSTDAVPSTAFAERPVNLDGGGHRVWEATGANFGEEPDDSHHDPIWSCEHAFVPSQLPDHAFKRGVPLGTECFRCFSRTYATILKNNPDSTPGSRSAEDRHKHTPEGDVAWQCVNCDMSLCGICKNEIVRERGLWVDSALLYPGSIHTG